MKKDLKRTLSIMLSLCLVLQMYQGEIIAIRPNERENYVPEFCGNKDIKNDKTKPNKRKIFVKK